MSHIFVEIWTNFVSDIRLSIDTLNVPKEKILSIFCQLSVEDP